MKPPAFKYERPTSVDAALEALSAHEDAKILAGGQSMIPMMNFRMAKPGTIVDINQLESLDHVREEDGEIAIGSLTRQATVEDSELAQEHCPLTVEALGYIGHKTIRHRGTFGGNLTHADPTSELPAVVVARDATFVIRGESGKREVPAEEFFQGYMNTDLGPTELLVELRYPKIADGTGWSFREEAPRKGDYATAGVAALVDVSDGVCTDVQLVYTAVGDGPTLVPEAEDAVQGEPPTEDTFEEAGDIAREELDPPSDLHGSSEYRSDIAATLTRRALDEAASKSGS